jgi:hypothetical protein
VTPGKYGFAKSIHGTPPYLTICRPRFTLKPYVLARFVFVTAAGGGGGGRRLDVVVNDDSSSFNEFAGNVFASG